jgi:hypothetical protein
MIHKGLEEYFNTLAVNALQAAHDSVPEDGDPYHAAMVRAMLTGYHCRWEGSELVVTDTEVEFNVPMVNPQTGKPSKTWRLGGKVDGLGVDGDKRLVIEHKTTSEDLTPGGTYWRRLTLDGQISSYLNAMGCHACLYDILRKPTCRPKKATPEDKRKFKADGSIYNNQRLEDECPDAFEERCLELIGDDPDKHFARGLVVRLEAERDEAAYDLWQTGRAIRESQLHKRWPRNPDGCISWSRECEYFGVCTGTEDIDNELVFKSTGEHAELTGL